MRLAIVKTPRQDKQQKYNNNKHYLNSKLDVYFLGKKYLNKVEIASSKIYTKQIKSILDGKKS